MSQSTPSLSSLVRQKVLDTDGDTRAALFLLAAAFDELEATVEAHLASCPQVVPPIPRTGTVAVWRMRCAKCNHPESAHQESWCFRCGLDRRHAFEAQLADVEALRRVMRAVDGRDERPPQMSERLERAALERDPISHDVQAVLDQIDIPTRTVDEIARDAAYDQALRAARSEYDPR